MGSIMNEQEFKTCSNTHLKFKTNSKNTILTFMTIGYNKSKDWMFKTGTLKEFY